MRVTTTLSLLLASMAAALPLPRPNTAGAACANEGQVYCANLTYQTCASGQWSASQPLAAGTTCGDYGFTDASTAPAPSPAPATPAPVNPAPKPVSHPRPSPNPNPNPGPSPRPSPRPSPHPSPNPSPPPTPAPAPPPAPAPAPVPSSGGVGKQTTPGAYVSYSGPASNFPSDTDSWLTFDALWSLNLPALQDNDNANEIAAIRSSVSTVAGEAAAAGYPDINENFIFALVMQESSGNVNVPTTNNGVRNPGLLQSHNGVAYSGISSIVQMVHDGILGTASGDGILQCRAQYGNIWAAARCYNSGSVDTANLSDGITSTGSYVSDVANRLRGAKSG